MGSDQSTPVGGFRLFRIATDGPAERAGLEVFFDFILEIDGLALNTGANHLQRRFVEAIKAAENQEIKMVVYSTRTQTLRDVWIYPTKWAGAGLLGATVRYDLFEAAETQGIRVLEVYNNSPAAEAGLIAWKDHILGTSEGFFRDMDDLADTISNSVDRGLLVIVYNADTEGIREVLISPTNDWGGQGCLGCNVGTGYLHRIRRSKSNPVPSKRGSYLRHTSSLPKGPSQSQTGTREGSEQSISPTDPDSVVVSQSDGIEHVGVEIHRDVVVGGYTESQCPSGGPYGESFQNPPAAMQRDSYQGGFSQQQTPNWMGDNQVQGEKSNTQDTGALHNDPSEIRETGYTDGTPIAFCDNAATHMAGPFQNQAFTGARPGVIYQANVIP